MCLGNLVLNLSVVGDGGVGTRIGVLRDLRTGVLRGYWRDGRGRGGVRAVARVDGGNLAFLGRVVDIGLNGARGLGGHEVVGVVGVWVDNRDGRCGRNCAVLRCVVALSLCEEAVIFRARVGRVGGASGARWCDVVGTRVLARGAEGIDQAIGGARRSDRCDAGSRAGWHVMTGGPLDTHWGDWGDIVVGV